MATQKLAEINLDTLFRPGSAARKIAERLMTGKPQTRSQLVEGLGTSGHHGEPGGGPAGEGGRHRDQGDRLRR